MHSYFGIKGKPPDHNLLSPPLSLLFTTYSNWPFEGRSAGKMFPPAGLVKTSKAKKKQRAQKRAIRICMNLVITFNKNTYIEQHPREESSCHSSTF